MKESLNQMLSRMRLASIKEKLVNQSKMRLKYETEAVSVIKETITHRKKLNFKNDRKLAIYESKLASKLPIISTLSGKR